MCLGLRAVLLVLLLPHTQKRDLDLPFSNQYFCPENVLCFLTPAAHIHVHFKTRFYQWGKQYEPYQLVGLKAVIYWFVLVATYVT